MTLKLTIRSELEGFEFVKNRTVAIFLSLSSRWLAPSPQLLRDTTHSLNNILRPRLAAEKLVTVYETLERPLPPVLADMECAGIRVDPERLRQLGHEFSMKMVDLLLIGRASKPVA